MATSFLVLVIITLKQCMSQCTNGNGCNSTDACDVEFVDGLVYGCSAIWKDEQGTDTDETDGACADGFHVCGDRKDPTDFNVMWNMVDSECVSSNIPQNAFYVTNLKSTDGMTCDDSDSNNVFGCGNPNTTWLYNTTGCGPFGLYLSNDSVTDGSETYGWLPCGRDQTPDNSECYNGERSWVIHNTTETDTGGVMCCRDTTANLCQSEGAQDCAKCAKYGPCLNSVDPKCITTEALDCLSCEDYAVCAACAPGWDVGCIAEEWHQADDSAYFASDGSISVINETNYRQGTNCERCDICGSGTTGVPIPFMLNGECSYLPIFGYIVQADCATNLWGGFEGEGKATAWRDSPSGLMPDIDLTNPGSNWTSVYDCSGIVMNLTREVGGGPNPNVSYSNPVDWNVNLDEENAICYNSTFSEDCDWSDNRTCSDKLWGMCGNDPMRCPSALHCGPLPCNMATDSNCIHIEIFDDNSYCDPVEGAGDYQAYVVADGTCRMDGSGRSYYTLGCNTLTQNVSGYIGCSEDTCDPSNCDQEVVELAPFSCHSEDWMGGLQIAGLLNVSAVCGVQEMTTTLAETTMYTTEAGTTEELAYDGDCGSDEAYLSIELAFDVCNMSPFNGNRYGLWDTIANCLCDAAIADSGVSWDYSADLDERRRLNNGKGRGSNNCDINVLSYELTELTDGNGLETCTEGYGVRFDFGIEACGDCAALNAINDGFDRYETGDLVEQVMICSNWAAKQIESIGFENFGNGELDYTLDSDCEVDEDESGVQSKNVNHFVLCFVVMFVVWKLH